VSDTYCIKAENLDIYGADVANILHRAKQDVDALF